MCCDYLERCCGEGIQFDALLRCLVTYTGTVNSFAGNGARSLKERVLHTHTHTRTRTHTHTHMRARVICIRTLEFWFSVYNN